MAGDRRYYGTQKGQRDIANKNMIGSQVLGYLPGQFRFKKRYLPRVSPGKWTRSKKRVLNDEYNTYYLDLLVSGYALAQSSGDKKQQTGG